MSKLDNIEKYYSEKIGTFGPSPKGVDWNSKDSQYNRFQQIARVISDQQASVTDLGCGYGEFFRFLSEKGFSGPYQGVDLSEAMIQSALESHGDKSNFKALVMKNEIPKADFVVASGIFSVKLDHSDEFWLDHILSTIKDMYDSCSKGISFNCLTSYSDKDKMRSDLYYAIPEEIFSYCKKNLSRQVALLHDYGIYEFTINVTKEN